MTIKVKSAAEVATKWAGVASQRGTEYKAGVAGAGPDWQKGAVNAAPAFKAAVQAPNIQQLFSGGVTKAGSDKYVRKASGVGADRYGPGVTAAQPDYQAGMDPMLATIASVNLPDRAPRGNTNNLNRVAAVDAALHAKRLALRAAGS